MRGLVNLTTPFQFCLTADPASMAVLVWTMLLTVAAGLVAAALTVQAAAARRLNRAGRSQADSTGSARPSRPTGYSGSARPSSSSNT